MGATNSRQEEDKGLQLCRARKKFIKQALNGRCSVAAAHIAYIEELKIIGNALRSFVEHDTRVESFSFPSRSVTPEPHTFFEKSISQLSLSSRSPSQYADNAMNMSPSQSPQVLIKRTSHRMKFFSSFSKKVEEKLPTPVTVSVTSTTPPCITPHSTDVPEISSFKTPIPSETPPWDYFGLFHPIDSHFPSQEGRRYDHVFEYSDEFRNIGEEEGYSNMEDVEKLSSRGAEESHESEDEFNQPASATLVRSFENINRATRNNSSGDSRIKSPESGVSENKLPNADNSIKPSKLFTNELPTKSSEIVTPVTKLIDCKKNISPDLSPLRATSSGFVNPSDAKISRITESEVEDKITPKDFFLSIKDIEHIFIKASESGKEVPRMLEANKFHFRPVFPGKESGSITSSLIKSCFSCGDDPSEVQQEPPQDSVKYLTWHRTTSSPSTSSRNLLGSNSIDHNSGLSKNLFEDFCMVSGSHASTLDRLYAWEKKLYDEVKAGQALRSNFDQKCKLLRHKESRGMNTEKTRAVVKDLHSRIRVSIHRINSISKKIEQIRDKELQPQLEELIEGLRKMWETMLECHSQQFLIISTSDAPGSFKTSARAEAQSQITVHLQNELNSLSINFTKWIGAQKIYIEAIDKWLLKCVSLPQNTSKRNRRMKPPPIRNFGPPIYMICGEWLVMIDKMPIKGVVDSIKDLAAEVAHFLPSHEKIHGKTHEKIHGKTATRSHKGTLLDIKNEEHGINTSRAEALEDQVPAFDGFHTSLTSFLGKLNEFAESSVKMYTELQTTIQDAKNNYEQFESQQPTA